MPLLRFQPIYLLTYLSPHSHTLCVQGIWKGKNKLTTNQEEEKAFLQTQKERIRAMEQREERDHVLMLQEGLLGSSNIAMEYNDDYDDQVGGCIITYPSCCHFIILIDLSHFLSTAHQIINYCFFANETIHHPFYDI